MEWEMKYSRTSEGLWGGAKLYARSLSSASSHATSGFPRLSTALAATADR